MPTMSFAETAPLVPRTMRPMPSTFGSVLPSTHRPTVAGWTPIRLANVALVMWCRSRNSARVMKDRLHPRNLQIKLNLRSRNSYMCPCARAIMASMSQRSSNLPGMPLSWARGVTLGFYGSNIKKEREVRELSRRELADILKVNPSQVTRWEQNKTIPSGDSLLKLSLIFGKNPYYFFSMGNEMPGMDLRAGLSSLLETSVGVEEAQVVSLMRWLPKEARARVVERAQSMAESARPDIEASKLAAGPVTRYLVESELEVLVHKKK